MPFYSVNKYGPSQLSHRHPFHGFGEVTATPEGMIKGAAPIAKVIKAPEASDGRYIAEGRSPFDFDYAQIDRQYYNTVQGYGAWTASDLWEQSKSPLLKGLISGAASYGLAKTIGVAPAKAVKLGVVMGVLEVGIGIVTNLLQKAQSEATSSQTTPTQQPQY
jgi:hypothetical protein